MNGTPVTCEKYGSGHINTTYKVVTDAGFDYIMQKINRFVFKDPKALMRNVAAIVQYLGGQTMLQTTDGKDFFVDSEGEYWRCYDFVPNSMSLDMAANADDFYESGVAFGRFQQALVNFDVKSLAETIPLFHHTPNRYILLKGAINNNIVNRLDSAAAEVKFALSREEYSHTLINLNLPLRVTHNDTKLNNVLFDKTTRKALCVIDLDTVMPGLSVNDFGDAIRFGASTAAEDEKDLSKVSMSLEMFEAFARGYIQNSGLTDIERKHLRDGAKMMTLECGVRFLTDYLNGDVYFNTAYPTQNLDRCRTQFKLVEDMELKWEEMQKIINEVSA